MARHLKKTKKQLILIANSSLQHSELLKLDVDLLFKVSQWIFSSRGVQTEGRGPLVALGVGLFVCKFDPPANGVDADKHFP